jgi:hypothetical protein
VSCLPSPSLSPSRSSKPFSRLGRSASPVVDHLDWTLSRVRAVSEDSGDRQGRAHLDGVTGPRHMFFAPGATKATC